MKGNWDKQNQILVLLSLGASPTGPALFIAPPYVLIPPSSVLLQAGLLDCWHLPHRIPVPPKCPSISFSGPLQSQTLTNTPKSYKNTTTNTATTSEGKKFPGAPSAL